MVKDIKLYIRGFFRGIGLGVLQASYMGTGKRITFSSQGNHITVSTSIPGTLDVYPRNFVGPLPPGARYATWWESYWKYVLLGGVVGMVVLRKFRR